MALTKSLTSYPALRAGDALGERHPVRSLLCVVPFAQHPFEARIWNHTNVLALSPGSTPFPIVQGILDAWFNTPIHESKA